MNFDHLSSFSESGTTPAYVFDLDILNERVNEVSEKLGNNIKLCFALKANPFLAGKFNNVVTGYEVCSLGELHICKRAGVDPKEIIFSGVNKTPTDVKEAIEYDVGILTVESPKHLALIHEYIKKYDKACSVLLRLSTKNQFGMDKETIEDIISRRDEYLEITFSGIHYFVGTQRKKSSDHLSELMMLKDWFIKLENKYGFPVSHFEYGPGFGVNYFTSDPTGEPDPVEAIAPLLQEFSTNRTVMVELGRYLSWSCGSYITKIDDIKHNDGVNYIIADGGIHHLTYFGQLMGMHRPFMDHIKTVKGNGETKNYMICGSLCSIYDILIRSIPLEDPHEGDLLVFHNTGAYAVTEGISLLLSRPLPRVFLYSKESGLILVRDFFNTDILNH